MNAIGRSEYLIIGQSEKSKFRLLNGVRNRALNTLYEVIVLIAFAIVQANQFELIGTV